ncbi:MAG: SDR family oxidoreductase [Candidatus Lambdaproteobacteria bacterium]|nr:SDR family oxidoreductase [Candidatus Lambdaproteobacteria bacterium]
MPAPATPVALVTGGARGIGFAIASALAESGAHVYLADLGRAGASVAAVPYPLSDAATLRRAVAGLAGRHPGRVDALPCDVREPGDVEAAIATIEAHHSGVDILVNNAGVFVLKPVPEMSLAEWDIQFAVIVRGAFLTARRALPGMVRRGWGRIVNVASVAGHRAIGTGAAYTAAKHALVGFTRALAMEAAGHGVTVNAVCPGTVATELVAGTGRALGWSPEETLRRFSERHLTGAPVAPEDVAAAVRWLASPEAARITGASLLVDDGWHVQ